MAFPLKRNDVIIAVNRDDLPRPHADIIKLPVIRGLVQHRWHGVAGDARSDDRVHQVEVLVWVPDDLNVRD